MPTPDRHPNAPDEQHERRAADHAGAGDAPELCPRCKKNPIGDSQELCPTCVGDELDEGERVAAREREAADQRAHQPRRGQPSPGPARQPQRQASPPAQPQAGVRTRAPQGNGQASPPANGSAGRPTPQGTQAIDKGKQARPSAAPMTFVPNMGLKEQAEKIVIYGPGGVGKTSILAAVPGVILIAMEATPRLTVPRFDEEKAPKTLQEFLAIVRWLKTGDHEFKALAIDSADELEKRIFAAVVERSNQRKEEASGEGAAENIEHVGKGYKKGYVAATTRWNEVLAELEQLRVQRNMRIIFSAHDVTTKKANPMGEDFEQYNVALSPDAGRPLLLHWADAVLFYNYVSATARAGKRGKPKGVGGRVRALWTTNSDAAYAKNRYDMPDQMNVTGSGEAAWRSIEWAIEVGKSPELLRKAIDEALAVVGEMPIEHKGQTYALADLVAQQLGDNPSRQTLAQVKNRLETRVAEYEAQQEAEADQAAATSGGE